jgi:hypothetical protein
VALLLKYEVGDDFDYLNLEAWVSSVGIYCVICLFNCRIACGFSADAYADSTPGRYKRNIEFHLQVTLRLNCF